MAKRLPLIFLIASQLLISELLAMSILTIENKCNYTVWPVIYSWNSQVSTTGFTLKKGASRDIRAPSSWYGIISGRTLCSAAPSTGKFWCATGDCESGKIECPNEDYGWSPVTYAYFRIDHDGFDSYTISVEYGYNLPLMIVPSTKSSSGTCITTSCMVDLNKTCPKDLVKFSREKPIACSSSCQESDDTPEICCTNEYKSKENCKPTMYTKNFESACPLAYVYAYDDNNSTFTCPNSTDYVITFCPSSISNTISNSNNRSSMAPLPAPAPKNNSLQKLKPIRGTTFIATTTLLLIHIFKLSL